jgi:hypothetical protein
MTPQEKMLYHQIHPLKLATDISAEIVSLYLFPETQTAGRGAGSAGAPSYCVNASYAAG